MNYFDFQAIGVYGQSGTSSTLKMRDYKDATDLVEVERERQYGNSGTKAYSA